MSDKKTKGRQKKKITKVEKDDDKLVTFSKRKTCIHNKINELSNHCGAEIGLLVYSCGGTPCTFGSPSFEAVTDRFLQRNPSTTINGDGSSSSSSMEELGKLYNSLVAKADAGEKRKTTLAAATTLLPVEENAWWKVDPKNEEEKKQLLKKFEGFYEELCEEVASRKKNGGGDASSSSSSVSGN